MNIGTLTAPMFPGVSVTSDQCVAAQRSQGNLSTPQLVICAYNDYAAVEPYYPPVPLPQVSRISEPAPSVIAAASTPANPMPNLPPQPVAVQSVPVAIITNDNLTQPLPDITKMFRPRPPVCSGWQGLNGMINDHPVIALAILGVAVTLAWGQRGR